MKEQAPWAIIVALLLRVCSVVLMLSGRMGDGYRSLKIDGMGREGYIWAFVLYPPIP